MRNIMKFVFMVVMVVGLVTSTTITAFAETSTGRLQLITRAEQSGNPIYGVYFGVYRADNVRITTLTTNMDGAASLSLAPGDYFLRNYGVPFGFLPERARIFFTVTDSEAVIVEVTTQRDMHIRYADYGPISLPQTGEVFPAMNYIIGAALMLLSIVLIIGILRLLLRKEKPVTTQRRKNRRV